MVTTFAAPVVCFGETMLRLSTRPGEPLEASGSLDVFVAGAESNVAVALARLGVPARWLSALPDSLLGRLVDGQLRRLGVGLEHVTWVPQGRLGLYFSEMAVAPRGSEVVYDRERSAFACSSGNDIDWSCLDDAGLLYVSGITGALRPNGKKLLRRSVAEARRRGLTVCLDVNYRAYLWSPKEARAALEDIEEPADLLVVSRRDLDLLWPGLGGDPETAARGLGELLGAEEIVMTLGEGGAGALTSEGWARSRGIEGESHDPIGRGDAFVAGYLWGRLEERSPEAALAAGCALAALAQTYRGDLVWATRTALDRVLAGESVEVRR